MAIALVALGTARLAKAIDEADAPPDAIEEPYAPTPEAAPIVTLGYREVAADIFWIRFLGYFGGRSTARGIEAIVDAIVALDPHYERIYEYGARAITIADEGVDQEAYLHAIAILERGIEQFPDDYKMPELAGQIYTQDLKTDDPAQRRAWQEKGVLLIESAIRKPGAPAYEATWAATMRTKLGEKQEAIKNLREMILLTSDVEARKKMIDRLAKIADADSDELADELYVEQHKLVAAWQHDRPDLPATMYILLGPRPEPGFDMTDLATGGRDLIVTANDDTAP